MQAPTVNIYSTPTCHFCHMAKDMFAANGIAFNDFNVLTDLEKRKEMVDKTGQLGVPVITVTPPDGKEQVMVGFNEELLRNLLGIK